MEDALLQEHSLAILGISLESEPPGEGDQTGIEQLAQFRQHADITALQVHRRVSWHSRAGVPRGNQLLLLDAQHSDICTVSVSNVVPACRSQPLMRDELLVLQEAATAACADCSCWSLSSPMLRRLTYR